MTLKDAFTYWTCNPRNIGLAAKSRPAVNAVLMKKYNDVHLDVFTEPFVRHLFQQCDLAQELKTKAASILVYLLEWGAEKGYCLKPNFDYTIASKDDDPEEDKCRTRPKDIAVFWVDREAQEEFMGLHKKNKKNNKNKEKMKKTSTSNQEPTQQVTSPVEETKNDAPVEEQVTAPPLLEYCSNEELLAEIRRRGWKGTVSMVCQVEL